MGPATRARLSAVARDGAVGPKWRRLYYMGLGLGPKILQPRSCSAASPSKEGCFLRMGGREYHIQPVSMRLRTFHEALEDPLYSRIRRQYDLSDHILDHKHFGLTDTDSIHCSAILCQFNACSPRDHSWIQCLSFHLFDGICERETCGSLCDYCCVRIPLSSRYFFS